MIQIIEMFTPLHLLLQALLKLLCLYTVQVYLSISYILLFYKTPCRCQKHVVNDEHLTSILKNKKDIPRETEDSGPPPCLHKTVYHPGGGRK